jgi:hypothetical protein
MIMDHDDRENNPFSSDFARGLFDRVIRLRKEKLDLAEKVSKFADRESGRDEKSEKPSPVECAVEEPQEEQPEEQEAKVIPISSARSYTRQDMTLGDVLNWYKNKKDKKIVAQEKALIKMTLKAIMLNSFSVEGPAGSGKTYILENGLMSVLPKDAACRIEFTTDAALFNKYEELNKYKILVFPEYQKILKNNPQIKELIKTITEGRVAKRQKMEDGDAVQQVIYPKCVITAIADENEFKDALYKDKEDMRRFSHIRLDTSYETTKRILEQKSQSRCSIPNSRKNAPGSLCERIREHLAECLDLKLENPPIDPFADYMRQHLPDTDKSIAYVDDYYSYLDGCAKFHHNQRMVESGNESFLVLDLADHFTVYGIYHKEFCDTLLKLENLKDFGNRVQKAQEPVDWKACFDAGVAKMCENFPENVVDNWVARQLKDKTLTVKDPVTQEDQVLFEYGG